MKTVESIFRKYLIVASFLMIVQIILLVISFYVPLNLYQWTAKISTTAFHIVGYFMTLLFYFSFFNIFILIISAIVQIADGKMTSWTFFFLASAVAYIFYTIEVGKSI